GPACDGSGYASTFAYGQTAMSESTEADIRARKAKSWFDLELTLAGTDDCVTGLYNPGAGTSKSSPRRASRKALHASALSVQREGDDRARAAVLVVDFPKPDGTVTGFRR